MINEKLVERVCKALGIPPPYKKLPYPENNLLAAVKEKLGEKEVWHVTGYDPKLSIKHWAYLFEINPYTPHADTELEALLLACEAAFCKEAE